MPGVLIVDDHPTMRKNIRALLSSHDVLVCAEASDGEEAVNYVRKLQPNVVLLDINMPVMNGIQAAYEIRRVAPSTKIVFLTIHDAPETESVVRLLADEFVPKSASGTELILTVRRLLQHQPEMVTA